MVFSPLLSNLPFAILKSFRSEKYLNISSKFKLLNREQQETIIDKTSYIKSVKYWEPNVKY